MIGVAISTTGDPHRLKFLLACVNGWRECLPLGSVIFVTVDGDEAAVDRVYETYDATKPGTLLRVGQPGIIWDQIYSGPFGLRDGRMGVATNKNTGIEALMTAGVDQLFLSDDDTWPVHPDALEIHRQSSLDHSMVCWGRNRLTGCNEDWAEWSWPRGSMMYVRSHVIEAVGGLDERFGPGGHEHVEWSRRIFQAGITPAEFCSPIVYQNHLGQGCRQFWNCEDMQKRGEPLGNTRKRRRGITSVRRHENDWEYITKIMEEQDGDTRFVNYTAAANGRESATLWTSLSAKEPGRT